MLKQRLITAFILIALVLWGILRLPTHYLALAFAVVILQGGWEWGGLMKLPSIYWKAAFIGVLAISMLGLWFLVDKDKSDWLALPVVSLFWWVLTFIWVLSYPKTAQHWSNYFIQFLAGFLILIPAWSSIIGLRVYGDLGPYLLLYLLSLIWVADTGAYFGGRWLGKHKLAPAVSPGKTWEGVFSAFIFTVIYALGVTYFLDALGNQWLAFVVLSQVTVIFSILGDLAESMFKRHAGVKDSSNILPGHGGLLDRIDSLTAAAPVFVVGLWLGGFSLGGGNVS
jgi:phosphatidate cytidylyltransferase